MDKLIEALSLLRDTIDGVGRAATETADNPKWRYHRDTPHMKKMAVIYAEWAAAVQVIIDNLPALPHAAGQDGEQCRAASGAPVAWIRPDGVTTSDAGLMRHWEAQGLQFEPLVRALSRGVPEGNESDENVIELLREDIECYHRSMDDRKVPREDSGGTLSMFGRASAAMAEEFRRGRNHGWFSGVLAAIRTVEKDRVRFSTGPALKEPIGIVSDAMKGTVLALQGLAQAYPTDAAIAAQRKEGE